MKVVDFGFVVALAVTFLVLLTLGIGSLTGWSFIHDKLRSERKEDEKEAKS